MSTAPNEIIEHFVQYLSNDDASLKSCALVCRSWAPVAQAHIFSDFDIYSGYMYGSNRKEAISGARKCEKLLAILIASPHLSRHIHHICICIRFNDGIGRMFTRLASLHSLLRLFSHAKRLELDGDMVWEDLSTNFLNSLRCLVSNPTFKELSLSGWEVSSPATELLPLLRCCAESLELLELDLSDWVDVNPGHMISDEPVEFRRLNQAVNRTAFVPGLFYDHTLHMPHLLTFHQYITFPTQHSRRPFDSMLPPCIPNTLPSLRLELGFLHSSNYNKEITVQKFPVLGTYTHMRHLTLITKMPLLNGIGLQSVNYTIGYFFSDIPIHNLLCLESVTVELSITIHINRADWDLPSWEVLDADLARLHGVGMLKKVTLFLRAGQPTWLERECDDDSGDDALVGVAEWIKARCQKLTEKELFHVKVMRFSNDV